MGSRLKIWVPLIIVSLIISITVVSTVSAQGEYSIPVWVKGVANFWVEDNISDDEFGEAITFLIEQGILRVEMPNMVDNSELKNKVTQLESKNAILQSEVSYLKKQNSKLQTDLEQFQQSSSSNILPEPEPQVIPYRRNVIEVNEKFDVGPFRILVIEAGYDLFVEEEKEVEYFRIDLEITNQRLSDVVYRPTKLSLIDSNGYAYEHKYTNGLKVNTVISSGSKLSGYYTFEKPAQLGIFKLFIEVGVSEDVGSTYNPNYRGEIEFDLR